MRNTLPDESRPQLLISLSYLPSAERLTVVVLKAKNLVVPANKENIGILFFWIVNNGAFITNQFQLKQNRSVGQIVPDGQR